MGNKMAIRIADILFGIIFTCVVIIGILWGVTVILASLTIS